MQGSNSLSNQQFNPPNLVCGINFSKFSKHVQFVTLASGVFSIFIGYGYIQEKIFHIPGFRSHGWFLSLLQFLFVTMISYIDSSFISVSPKLRERPPYSSFVVLACLTVGTMGLSTVALGFLNFPTQVIFKSCKLIPVMIGGILILGKRYTLADYLSVFLMSFGLVWFSLADQTISPDFNPLGIVLITMALGVDAIYGNFQEKIIKKHPHFTNADIAFYSYAFGAVMLAAGLLVSGQLFDSISFTSHHTEVYPLTLIYSTLGYLGVQCVLALITSSGVLVATIVTTMRKVLTVILSFVFFTKPFTFQYVWSGGLVFAGIGMSIYIRNRVAILHVLSVIITRILHVLAPRGRKDSSSSVQQV